MIHGAASGSEPLRSQFAERYLPLVQRYLGERWRGSPLAAQIDDATQEVFVECIRDGGILERVDAGRAGGFRPFLFGAIRNVARRFEVPAGASARRESVVLDELQVRDQRFEALLDREWARSLMAQAAQQHRTSAVALGADARRGVELLRLRFEEGLPVRDIATRWGEEPAAIHRLYRRARREFQRSLRKVVAFHQPGTTDVDGECQRLLALLGGA